jgi:hypothetical protein
MKKIHSILLSFLLTITFQVQAQDVAVLMKEAQNLDIQLKEPEALAKYQQILVAQPNNIKALVRSTELNTAIGGRQTDKKAKKINYETAYAFAQRALAADTNSADAYYAMAMASGKMTEVETENKKVVSFVRDIKLYADKALSINPNHAKANYTLGKWHLEMLNLSGFKKLAVKAFYGGLPNATIEKAIEYMEKCKAADQYFVLNYLDLAKAYKQDNKPAKAIEVLNKLIKLPNRTFDDVALKAEGKKILDGEMQ